MIFPILRGILTYKLAPVTWTIFILNLFIYMFVTAPISEKQKSFTFGDIGVRVCGKSRGSSMHNIF